MFVGISLYVTSLSDQDICFYIRLSHQSVSDLDLIHFKGVWPPWAFCCCLTTQITEEW